MKHTTKLTKRTIRGGVLLCSIPEGPDVALD